MHVVLNETCQNSWYLIHIPQKFEPLTPMTCVHQKPLIQKKASPGFLPVYPSANSLSSACNLNSYALCRTTSSPTVVFSARFNSSSNSPLMTHYTIIFVYSFLRTLVVILELGLRVP